MSRVQSCEFKDSTSKDDDAQTSSLDTTPLKTLPRIAQIKGHTMSEKRLRRQMSSPECRRSGAKRQQPRVRFTFAAFDTHADETPNTRGRNDGVVGDGKESSHAEGNDAKQDQNTSTKRTTEQTRTK